MLLPLMCIKIDVLFSVIRMVRVWCSGVISAAAFINNVCKVAHFGDRVPRYGSVEQRVVFGI